MGGIIALLVIAGGRWLLKAPKQKYQVGWSWPKTGLVIGALSVAAWLASGVTNRDYGFSFTQPTISIVSIIIIGGDSAGINWGTFMVLGVPVGAFLAAKITGELSLRAPATGRLIEQFGGGTLMGLGAALAGGCNIGHGITGVSTLALSSIVATLFTVSGVWGMDYLVFRLTARAAAGGITAVK